MKSTIRFYAEYAILCIALAIAITAAFQLGKTIEGRSDQANEMAGKTLTEMRMNREIELNEQNEN